MSFSKEYSKDMFKQDLEKRISFAFKGKTWITVMLYLFNLIFISIGIFFTVNLIPLSPFHSLIAGFISFAIIIEGVILTITASRRMIEITPEGVSWKGGFSSGYINFIDVEDVSYFPSPFLNLHTVKLFLSNNKKIKLRTSFMTKPRNWYSEEMIRTIIDTYWTEANPKAKYSTESVTSKPSTRPKSISLLKPGASTEQSEASQGYKCPSCLFIHDKEHKFCIKCGAEMG